MYHPKVKKRKHTGFDKVNVLIMLGILFITLYPFWYCIIVSFNEAQDLSFGPLYFLPRKVTLANYEYVLSNSSLTHAFFISVARTVAGMAATTLFTGIAAYGLSKKDLIGRRLYSAIFIIPMYFGGGLIPTYLLMKNLGLLNNFLVYIIPSIWSFYYAILFMAYYETIPESLEESARIDGANSLTIFFRVIFPVSIPIFATIAMYCCVGQWNAWFDNMIYIKRPNLHTLQYYMTQMTNEYEAVKQMKKLSNDSSMLNEKMMKISPTTIRVAMMVVTTFPIVVVYPFFQKYFVKGIMLGSVKG